MFSKIKLTVCILLLFNISHAMNIQELDTNNILNFVEIDKQNNQVTFKKNSLPLLQELLDNKQEKSIFSKENIFGVTLLGIVLANCYFLFQLFDVAKKNSEDIDKQASTIKDLQTETTPLETQLNELETETNLLQKTLEKQNKKNKQNNKNIKNDIKQMKEEIETIQEIQKIIALKTNKTMKNLAEKFNELIETAQG